MKRLTTEEFIDRAISVHGHRYSYKKTEYLNSTTKVVITCPEHGDFQQLPLNHTFHGCDCPKCIPTPVEDFLKDAVKVHGDRYDYSNIQYKSITIPIELICPFCGELFYIAPYKHLAGYNHAECRRQRQSITNLKSTEFFIRKAKEVHGDKYDYSISEYEGRNKYVNIICPIHGVFEQIAGNHMIGCGCPSCAGRNIESWSTAVLYVVSANSRVGVFTGFGITSNWLARRNTHKKSLDDSGFSIVSEWKTHDISRTLALQLERQIKDQFNPSDLAQEIVGFKTESTDKSFDEVVNFAKVLLG